MGTSGSSSQVVQGTGRGNVKDPLAEVVEAKICLKPLIGEPRPPFPSPSRHGKFTPTLLKHHNSQICD